MGTIPSGKGSTHGRGTDFQSFVASLTSAVNITKLLVSAD
jgi:hypothetical protein